MRYRQDTQQWVHTSDEEKFYGMDKTPLESMPPSFLKMLAAARTSALEEAAREAMLHAEWNTNVSKTAARIRALKGQP